MEKLKQARERLNELVLALRSAADAYEQLAGDATEEQRSAASTAFDTANEAVKEQRAEAQRLERIEEARAANPAPEAPEAREPIHVGREPLTYEAHHYQRSYLLDMARAEFGRGDVAGARQRLAAHGREMDVEVKAERERREARFNSEIETLYSELPAQLRQRLEAVGFEPGDLVARRSVQKRAISRIDGSGGDFVPPLYLLDQYAPLARARRPFADAVPNIPLPAGTDMITIPRITTGTQMASQTQDNQAVNSQDLATSTVTAPVRTIAGQQDIALQLLDQSPINFDQIVFKDLMADYALQLDTQCLSGSGVNGQVLGILNVVGVNSVAYTDGTPTVPELYPKLADALNQAAAARKIVPTHFWWASRRWFWAAKELDSSNRPFFVSLAGNPSNGFNSYGPYSEQAVQGGPVTNVIGVPVWLENSMPTNLGGGTNEDRVVATVMDDHLLFEGDLNARALKEVLSGTLAVRLQVYAYVAFTAGRFPSATSVVSGTGLVTPTF